jgi:hypothetical protein
MTVSDLVSMGFDEDEIVEHAGTAQVENEVVEALTPAILDYVTAEKGATASTSDFKQMTNGLAQALNGNFSSLTRVGFVIDEKHKEAD